MTFTPLGAAPVPVLVVPTCEGRRDVWIIRGSRQRVSPLRTNTLSTRTHHAMVMETGPHSRD
jgi:hypothetical protein